MVDSVNPTNVPQHQQQATSVAGNSQFLTPSASNDNLQIEPSETQCVVTGINGFIARHLAFQLLCKGYKVLGTIRPPPPSESDSFPDMESYTHNKLPYLKHWIQIFGPQQIVVKVIDFTQDENAQLLEKLFEGAYCVFHTASPVFFNAEPPSEEEAEEMYYKPAVNGTRLVLEACEASKVTRVILTSSTATLFNPYQPPRSGIVSECDWNQSSKLTDAMGAYRISKVKAERFAWEFCRYLTSAHKIQLVTVLPTFVIGPPFPNKVVVDELSSISTTTTTANTEYLNEQIQKMIQDLTSNEESIELVKKSILTSSILEIYKILLQNEDSSIIFNSDNVGIVDVRDVASCHILAMEKRQAKGNRFICCHSTRNYVETFNRIAQVFREQFHVENVNFLPIYESSSGGSYGGGYGSGFGGSGSGTSSQYSIQMKKIDGSKAEKTLGLQYTPFEQTVREMCQSFVEMKFISDSNKLRPRRRPSAEEKHVKKERYTVMTDTLFP